MGEAKDTIKGTPPATPSGTPPNLVQQTKTLRDGVSHCLEIKQKDVEVEGNANLKENLRKVSFLKEAYTLLEKVEILLEGY